MRNLPRKNRGFRLASSAFAFGASAIGSSAFASGGEQPGGVTQSQDRRVILRTDADPGDPSSNLNPTDKPITLTISGKDGASYLGDVIVTINPDDSLEFSVQRALDLLSSVVSPDVLESLRTRLAGKNTAAVEDFASVGIGISYNPRTLELNFSIPSERRVSRSVFVSPLDRDRVGTVVKPAEFSAYVNVRGSVDHISDGASKGFNEPVFFLDGAMRVAKNAVVEGEAFWQPGTNGADFQRQGTRLVIDDTKNLMRWTVGDLQPIARGFQVTPDLAGISLIRSYSALNPQQIIRPRGDRSFLLERASLVEVQVNGQIARRLQLDPGTYNLRDFPFTQGANDVRLSIEDDTGRTEVLRFNLFLEQSQLAKGLSEFGVYSGVYAPLGRRGPNYSKDLVTSGFFRRGISDQLTLGANFQVDKWTKMAGIEAVFGTTIGTFATNFAVSDIDSIGTGWATTATFQRLFQRSNGLSDSFNIFFESRSPKFGAIGVFTPANPYSYEIGSGYSHAFNDRTYMGFDGRFSKGRGIQLDQHSYRVTSGYRISPAASLSFDVRYDKDAFGDRVSGLVSLTVRLGGFSSVRTDYDTRNNRARLSYQTLRGQGVGSYNISADIERSDLGAGMNFSGNYYHNRAEIGLSHSGAFTDSFGRSVSQRSSLRLATSLALADGEVAIGRPIYDSFAIVKAHDKLKGANVLVDPSPYGFTAQTGKAGTALQPSLSSYSERTISVDSPTAPMGTDLGTGTFRVFPTYRSGYVLTVGSDYSMTAIGVIQNRDGQPVSLLTGKAIEVAHPEKPAQDVFTNREGKFGLSGLAPGKWRLEMADAEKTIVEINIPENNEAGYVQLGTIRPTEGQ